MNLARRMRITEVTRSLKLLGPVVAVVTLLILAHSAVAQGMARRPLSATLPSQQVDVAFPSMSFERMVHLTHAGDGSDRLWLVLQPGEIVVFDNSPSAPSPRTFLDIRDRVNDEGNEEGLLGLAFPSDHAESGHFFVYYSAANPGRSVVSRFSVTGPDPDQADPNSELLILEIPQPFSNHNGGTLEFGPDGNLYVSLGDGGSGGDPLGNGQNLQTALGSILRLDVSNASAQQPFEVPPDNPFADAPSEEQRWIWAYGFRNPWKLSFDAVTGDLWTADVGQSSHEEVDVVLPGRNYGWNIMEGFSCYPSSTPTCDQSGLELPVFKYDHDEGCSVTGGHVYRGSRLPDLAGTYVYGDFCSGRIWGLRYDGATVTEQALLIDTDLAIPSFGVDEVGELFILSFDGSIYQFSTPPPTPTPVPTLPLTGDPGVRRLAYRIALAGGLAVAVGILLLVTAPLGADRRE